MTTNNLGATLRKRRELKKLTLKHLSSICGVSASEISRVERESRSPKGHILKRLAEPLGFKETELLKLAGFLSRDESDDRQDRFKVEIKKEIADTLVSLRKKIDSL